MTDQKQDQVPPIEQLDRKMNAVINHTADQFGKMEAQAKATSDVLEQLSTDFLESHNGLSDQFKSLEALVKSLNEQSRTTDRAALFGALAAAQKQIKNADANIENAFLKNKYADLASCLNAVRGPLSENGIALIQLTEDQSAGVLGIRTILAHESGQTLEDTITMAPPKLDPQGIGSCRTYMRRYSLMAICGIAGAHDDDAEGTKAVITPTEVEQILYRADELFADKGDEAIEHMLKKVFETSGAKVVGEIPAGEADAALHYLTRFKQARDTKLAAEKKKEEAAAKQAKAEAKK
jgi:hypothetical protein